MFIVKCRCCKSTNKVFINYNTRGISNCYNCKNKIGTISTCSIHFDQPYKFYKICDDISVSKCKLCVIELNKRPKRESIREKCLKKKRSYDEQIKDFIFRNIKTDVNIDFHKDIIIKLELVTRIYYEYKKSFIDIGPFYYDTETNEYKEKKYYEDYCIKYYPLLATINDIDSPLIDKYYYDNIRIANKQIIEKNGQLMRY